MDGPTQLYFKLTKGQMIYVCVKITDFVRLSFSIAHAI